MEISTWSIIQSIVLIIVSSMLIFQSIVLDTTETIRTIEVEKEIFIEIPIYNFDKCLEIVRNYNQLKGVLT